jgi:hypothetical protein
VLIVVFGVIVDGSTFTAMVLVWLEDFLMNFVDECRLLPCKC